MRQPRTASELPVEHPVSAGGVVYRQQDGQIEILLCGRLDPETWGLPKGTPNPGESLEETARREVEEETGLKVQVEGRIGLIRYWFDSAGVRHHKTVHFFLMVPTAGSTEDHDPEFDVVQWFPVEKTYGTLTHRNESRLVRKAMAKLVGGARSARPGDGGGKDG